MPCSRLSTHFKTFSRLPRIFFNTIFKTFHSASTCTDIHVPLLPWSLSSLLFIVTFCTWWGLVCPYTLLYNLLVVVLIILLIANEYPTRRGCATVLTLPAANATLPPHHTSFVLATTHPPATTLYNSAPAMQPTRQFAPSTLLNIPATANVRVYTRPKSFSTSLSPPVYYITTPVTSCLHHVPYRAPTTLLPLLTAHPLALLLSCRLQVLQHRPHVCSDHRDLKQLSRVVGGGPQPHQLVVYELNQVLAEDALIANKEALPAHPGGACHMV